MEQLVPWIIIVAVHDEKASDGVAMLGCDLVPICKVSSVF
jgi:hypothetical protein